MEVPLFGADVAATFAGLPWYLGGSTWLSYKSVWIFVNGKNNALLCSSCGTSGKTVAELCCVS